MKKISCKREGDEVVIRIPADFPTPVIAAVTAAGGVSGGWVVLEGATSEIPLAVRNLLSASPVPVDRLCVDLFRSECGASLPEKPTTHCHFSRPGNLQSQDGERLAASSHHENAR